MFFVGKVVKPSGKGRTAWWDGMIGTVDFKQDMRKETE